MRARGCGWGFRARSPLPVWRISLVLCLLWSGLLWLSGSAMSVRAQDVSSERLFGLINQVRRDAGLPPLGSSTLLSQAAQRHADDLVVLGRVTHEGSDGSGYQQRIREARYQAWNDGLMVNEVLWAGLGTAEDALSWFYSNPEWEILTDPRYREMGIGYANDDGVRYFVVNVGSRPGVLPIAINDGAATSEFSQVALRLTNEDAVPLGDMAWMGRAIEVRISNTPDFEGQSWQPWEPLLPWQLAGDEPGEYAVYVEFRDGAGRTAVAEDTVRLVLPGESLPTATPFLDFVPLTPPSTIEPPMSSGTPTSPAVVGPGSTAESPTLPPASQEDLTPFPTWTPLPTHAPDGPERDAPDWLLLTAFLLQGAAVLLGVVVFLRRR